MLAHMSWFDLPLPDAQRFFPRVYGHACCRCCKPAVDPTAEWKDAEASALRRPTGRKVVDNFDATFIDLTDVEDFKNEVWRISPIP